MTPEQAFLVAISEAPQDDTPRLVYADWLEEHNQRDRAEFIRVQCQLAAMGEVKCERTGESLAAYGEFTDRCRCSSCKVKRREYLCSRRHIEWEWTPEPVIGVYHIFRRGFIASITLASDAFLQHAADIIEAVPMLEEVRLSDKEPVENRLNPGRWAWLDELVPGAEELTIYGLMSSRARLPPLLFTHVKGGRGSMPRCRWYDSKEEASAAISPACLTFARERLADRNRLAGTVTI